MVADVADVCAGTEVTETDWCFLLDTAVLHAEFWLGDRSVAGELRLRAAKFGATPEDRARLRIAVGEPDAQPAPPRLRTKAQESRRERALRAVVDGGFVPTLPARPGRAGPRGSGRA